MDFIKREGIFQYILEHEKDIKKTTHSYNPFQKWTMIMMGLFIVAAFMMAILGKESKWQSLLTYSFIGLAQISAFLYLSSEIIQSFKFIVNPIYDILESISRRASDDYNLAKEMIRFEISDLEYTLERLRFEISQIKSFVGLFIGAVEKVGILPLVITAVLAVHDHVNGKTTFEGVGGWAMFVLTVAYIAFALILMSTHKLERYVLVIENALKLKKSKNLISKHYF